METGTWIYIQTSKYNSPTLALIVEQLPKGFLRAANMKGEWIIQSSEIAYATTIEKIVESLQSYTPLDDPITIEYANGIRDTLLNRYSKKEA
jgi:hypothetical protein